MQGKTHLVVGCAAALFVCRPLSWNELIWGAGAAMVGSVISDIDAGSSSAHRDADKVTAFMICVVVGILMADVNFHLGIYSELMARISQPRLITLMGLFVILCALGKATKHRTFMHSLCALALLTGCLYLLNGRVAMYFGTGFAVHLVLDALNQRKVSLLWPAKKGFCLGLCRSSGWVNTLCFSLGLAALIYVTAVSVPVKQLGITLRDMPGEILHGVQAVRSYIT